jgi:HSP20 family protein
MAELTPRYRSLTAPRTFGHLLGFDPFRNFTGASLGVEVTRTDDGGYTVELPVAGYKPDEIDVTLEDNVLTVVGKSEKRNFTRSLLLPEEIDGENIGAKVEHGLLTLTLNIHAKAQPRKITISHN